MHAFKQNSRFLLLVAIWIATLASPAYAAKPGTYQFSPMVDFTALTPVAGTGSMLRNRNRIKARLSMSGLDSDTAYTVWWVVWNNPALCANGVPGVSNCGVQDLGVNGNAVFYAAGFVTGTDGVANMSLSLKSGKLPSGADAPIPGLLRPGNGLKAEVHVVVRTHGPVNTDILTEQLSLFQGGCSDELGNDNGLCYDQQLVAFQPVK